MHADLIARLRYVVENPSAWEAFDQNVSDLIAEAIAALSAGKDAPAGVEVKALVDFICDDVLPSYGVASEVGRNDPELAEAVKAHLSALAPKDAEPVAWPEGFFVMEPRTRLYECATEGCGQRTSIRIERGGAGSNHCEPCARKIAAIIAAHPAPEPAGLEKAVKIAEAEFYRTQGDMHTALRAALPHLSPSPQAVPEGMVLVPQEPTEAMIDAHFRAHAEAETVFADVPVIWRAMIAASPTDGGRDGE